MKSIVRTPIPYHTFHIFYNKVRNGEWLSQKKGDVLKNTFSSVVEYFFLKLLCFLDIFFNFTQ